jgi:hypothetical protein
VYGGAAVWNWLYFTLLVPVILKWLLEFCKIYVPLFCRAANEESAERERNI